MNPPHAELTGETFLRTCWAQRASSSCLHRVVLRPPGGPRPARAALSSLDAAAEVAHTPPLVEIVDIDFDVIGKTARICGGFRPGEPRLDAEGQCS